jgi:protein SCO1
MGLPESDVMLAAAKLPRVLMVVLVALLAAIGAVLVFGRDGSGSGSSAPAQNPHSRFDGPSLPNVPAPRFSLRDQHGRRIILAHDRGRVVLLTFIHSLCHDACPFMIEQVKGALNELPHHGTDVPVIGMSVAQKEDSVANRNAFLRKHQMDGRVAFVNGSLAQMTRLWHAYKVQPVTPKVDHSAFVILIDKRGRERVGFPADQLTPEDLAHDIRVLQAEKA